MPYKRVYDFFHLRNEMIQLKKMSCEQKISQLRADIVEIRQQQQQLSVGLATLWTEVTDIELSRDYFFAMKRKEALLLARYYRLELKIKELAESMEAVEQQRLGFQQLQVICMKKKEKWQLLNKRLKKQRAIKKTNQEERQMSEGVIWRKSLSQ